MLAIVPEDSVRKYSVRFPEGTIAVGSENPYTGGSSTTNERKGEKMDKNLFDTILNAVALAMGVVVLVMNTLGTLEVASAITFLGIGLSALSLARLQKN